MSESDSVNSPERVDGSEVSVNFQELNRPRRGRPRKYLTSYYETNMNGENQLNNDEENGNMMTLQDNMAYNPGLGLSTADIRRQANRLIQQRRRANEPEEVRQRRLALEAQARRMQRANETEEQRRERLRKNAEHIRLSRAMETPEEREIRRQKMAEHRRQTRAVETEEQRRERLRKCALARRASRMNESEEVKAQRRQREAAARRLARMNETDEERAERRRKTAEARRRSLSASYSDAGSSSMMSQSGLDRIDGGGEHMDEHDPMTAATAGTDGAFYETTEQPSTTANPHDSERVRQQIFRKKFRPHDIMMQANASGNGADATVQMMADDDDSSDDEQEHSLIMVMPPAATASSDNQAASNVIFSQPSNGDQQQATKKRAVGKRK
jgi:hypothetical protein